MSKSAVPPTPTSRWVRLLCGSLAVGMIVSLLVGGAQPAAVGLIQAPWDKLAHMGFFLALTLLLCELFSREAWIPLAIAITLALVDEWHQIYLPGRTFGWGDLMADSIGALLAIYLVRTLRGATHTGMTEIRWIKPK